MVELDPRKIIYGQIDEGNQSHIHFVLIKTWIFRVAYQGGIWRTANLVSLMELFELTFFSKKVEKIGRNCLAAVFLSIRSSTQQRTVIFINMFFSSPSDSTFKECQVILKSGI